MDLQTPPFQNLCGNFRAITDMLKFIEDSIAKANLAVADTLLPLADDPCGTIAYSRLADRREMSRPDHRDPSTRAKWATVLSDFHGGRNRPRGSGQENNVVVKVTRACL